MLDRELEGNVLDKTPETFETQETLKESAIARLDALAKLDRRLAWVVTTVPFVGFVVAITLLFFGYGGWTELVLLFAMYVVTMIGVEVGYHRYFTHGSFKTHRAVEIILAILGGMAFQGPLIWWSATHRRHHHFSDQPGDPHSPNLHTNNLHTKGLKASLRGLIHSHMGWIFVADSTRPPGWAQYAHDLYRDNLFFQLHMFYFYWLVLGLAIPSVIDGILTRTWQGAVLGFLWGGLVRIFLLNQFVWALNSICHVYGIRAFNTPHDLSRNNAWLAIPTLGQGWHNNHHAFPSSAITGLEWWQIDISGWLIRGLQFIGLAWDVKAPTPAMVQSRKKALNSVIQNSL